MKKRIISTLSVVALVATAFPSIISAQAMPIDTAEPKMLELDGYVSFQPLWQNARVVTAELDFNGTTAEAIVTIIALDNSTISGTARLERVNANGTFTLIRSWPLSAGTSLRFAETQTVARGHEYRISVNASVTRNGFSETITTEARNTLR